MTLKEVLEETKAMWLWLSEHPWNTKVDYFEYTKKPIVLNTCYLCEYVYNAKTETLDCDVCPLKEFWTKQMWISPTKGHYCTKGNTSYSKWSATIGSEREKDFSRYALEIAMACEIELKKLDKR